MFAEWKDRYKDEPPIGRPLMVTIKREWQSHTETVACACYYLVDPRDGKKYFYEAADLNNGRIGPDSVKVIAWDYWPDSFVQDDVL